jgi:hypothetical protein
MAMSVARSRPGGAILAALLAVTVGGIAVAVQPGSRRSLAAGIFVLALAAGLAAARLPGPRPQRTIMERLNDLAFATVVLAVSLVAALALRPWLVALPGLATGFLAGRVARPPSPAPPADEGGAR